MGYRLVLIVFLSAVSCQLCVAQNVVLLTIDSCRADRVNESLAPNIHTWLKTGVKFTHAYSTSAWTAPGLVSILTGLYPATHGVNNRDHMGSADLVTLPKIFKERGYLVPNLNFFTFAPYYRNLGLAEIQHEYFGSSPGDELINWLNKNAGTPHTKPFFVWYHTTMIHQPYNPPAEDLPAPQEELQKSPGIKAVMTGAIVPRGSTSFTDEDRPILDALYNAEVRRVDRFFKRVLDLLREKNLIENTLIVVTADHGEELLDHGFVGHASTSLEARLYEEFLRIPLMISWPGKVPANRTVTAPVSQIDIFPTLLNLFGIKAPAYIQGRDLLGKVPPDRPLFFESVIAGNQTTADREHLWLRAIRQGNYQYIEAKTLGALRAFAVNADLPLLKSDLTYLPALFNLKSDPAEMTNLVPEKPALAASLRRELDAWHGEATALRNKIFPSRPQVFSPGSADCPVIHTPEDGKTLHYEVHTGMVLFDWSGDTETTYLIEYDIGTGDHHVAGTYEVRGNHQLLGPLPRELWENLKAWNPFKFRVSPKSEKPCWSTWVVFYF